MSTVAVVGAGTMGHGIAQVAAVAGWDVCLTDANAEVLDAALGRIKQNLDGGVRRGKISEVEAAAALGRVITADLPTAVGGADVVIEAVNEDLGLKRRLFEMIDQHASPTAILATNTSSLSVSDIASATHQPERVIGMHFFNPVHIMKLVEIVVPTGADEDAVNRIQTLATEMGKEPIRVGDTPGFASSRLGIVLGLEAMRMVEQHVATPEDIDRAMQFGYGHPMGPLRVTDLVGLDVRLAIADYLYDKLRDDQYRPPEILRRKVSAGELGKKSGKGFYDWTD